MFQQDVTTPTNRSPRSPGSDRARPQIILIFAVVGIALLTFVAGFVFLRPRHGPIESVAVLPFSNGSSDPNAEYLSDGISESLINELSQVPNLRVMARSTVFRYKGKGADPQKIGNDLHVQAVLSGRLLQQGDVLIVQAELMDVKTGVQIWGGAVQPQCGKCTCAARRSFQGNHREAAAEIDRRGEAAPSQAQHE